MDLLNEEIDEDWLDLDDSFFYKEGEVLEVGLNVVVLNLADIETEKFSYRMRLELWVCWPLSKIDLDNYINDPYNWVPTLHPQPAPWTIDIDDSSMMPFLSGRTTQVFIWQSKIVACECTLITARFLESMELQHFPFDCQHFNFHIGIRCDCDIPLKSDQKSGKIKYKKLEKNNGFYNFDGRAMAKVKLTDKACTFNVRTHLLVLQDFELCGIECEIENKSDDIPFLHCSLRLSRNYTPYIYRIFLPMFIILLFVTSVFYFPADGLDSRLNFIITILLTIVAFLIILSDLLPTIPYLTTIDKYTLFGFCYILLCAILCMVFNICGVENTPFEHYFFTYAIILLISIHIWLIYYCYNCRKIELNKMTIDRHEVSQNYDPLLYTCA